MFGGRPFGQGIPSSTGSSPVTSTATKSTTPVARSWFSDFVNNTVGGLDSVAQGFGDVFKGDVSTGVGDIFNGVWNASTAGLAPLFPSPKTQNPAQPSTSEPTINQTNTTAIQQELAAEANATAVFLTGGRGVQNSPLTTSAILMGR